MKTNFNNSKANLVIFAFIGESDNTFFKGEKSVIYPVLNSDEILLGLGDKEKFNLDVLKEAVYALGRYLIGKDINEISFEKNRFDLSNEDYALGIVEALKVSQYVFDHYKKEKKELNLKTVNLVEEYSNLESKVNELLNVLDAQFFARDLVNLRSNDIYPETLANKANERLSELGIEVKIYEEDEIREMGLTAFLEVARGSANRPRLIVMEYMNGGDEKPLVFVGKGVTYDTGGYSLKPTTGMLTMNCDMGGSATVIGAMEAIAKNKIKTNVVAIVAACENSISGNAYKPGDIIKARNGMSIDIANTDAEGRLTLADAVNYGVDTYKPSMIIDLATLTGAVLIALGETYTGVVTNNQEAFNLVQKAANEANEKIWQLPNDDFIRTYNKSDDADIKNSGGRYAGSVTAGQFIEAFVEDYPWVHLDIAGTAYLSAPQGLNQKGATGVHVKTLYNLAKNNQ